MAENQRLEEIAKELTIEFGECVSGPDDPTPEEVGKYYGNLYKAFLKSVREAWQE